MVVYSENPRLQHNNVKQLLPEQDDSHLAWIFFFVLHVGYTNVVRQAHPHLESLAADRAESRHRLLTFFGAMVVHGSRSTRHDLLAAGAFQGPEE